MHQRLYHLDKRTLLAGGINVRQEHFVQEAHTRSPECFHQTLLADSALSDTQRNAFSRLERTWSLALQLTRQLMKRDSFELQSLTMQALLQHLFFPRGYRANKLRESVAHHPEHQPAEAVLPPRLPKISVCMACYNSGHYIDLQLQSILSQLSPFDEVVIVDDNSTDGTPERIRSFADPRIRLIQHITNVGVTPSFEHALRSATGDLLFLSDHDDIWAPDKVLRFREAFAMGPQVKLVMSAVSLIDSDGVSFHDKRHDRDGKFRRGFFRNVLRNTYQGSALAIRSDLVESVLPFPRDRAYLHDAWIGTLNDRLRGGMVFLPQPLLFYRRHDANVSQRMTTRRRILSRTQLLWDHALHALYRRNPKDSGT